MSEIHFPLIIAQFLLSGHRKGENYRHWSLVALESKNIAHIFETTGDSSTFVYTPRQTDSFSRSADLLGGYCVGHIAHSQLAWLTEKLREITVVRYDDNWDCQTWVLEAIMLLKDIGGIITENVGPAHIRKELEIEFERWDSGEDTVEERLFPEE
ncbi:hypothetical protein BDZ94DRAFT_1314275 [Collybia nuda]|uniref:Uncharacterized protein n=1 Tax=Collybia nuda TaxID=64659 RepID=A0A9P5XX93_9AGAR|nr:hypothetical protein BDZ94DRAFT_1314275 [Collybia nuda]